MGNNNHKSSKKRALYINTFRVIASLLLIYIVYRYLYNDFRIVNLWENIEQVMTSQAILPLCMIVLLMPINWLIESIKWKEGLKPVHNMSIYRAFTSVFQGITLGIITPARVGEYGGRILYLAPEHRIPGVASTFICSIYQNLINVFIASLVLLLPFGTRRFINEDYQLITGIGILVSVATFLVLLFLPKIVSYVASISWLKAKMPKLHVISTQLQQINRQKVFVLSLFRYLVYCLQYVLIFQIFSIDFSAFDTLLAIAIVYGIQTILPLTPLLQVGLRGSIALYVFSPIAGDENRIILGSYGIWLLNILIPSIIGGMLMIVRRGKSD